MARHLVNNYETLANPCSEPVTTAKIKISPCPHCRSKNVRVHHCYQTKMNGERKLYQCQDCERYFAETYGSPIAGLTTELSKICQVIKARMEGMGLNQAVRTFKFAKNTIINWEKRLASLQEPLFLYSLMHDFLQIVIEGDELYTKVEKNKPPAESEGWTIVLMERATRFLWTLKCGEKQRRLFLAAVATLAELFDQSDALVLFTDGERRYSQLVFDICHELFYSGKPGRPPQVLPKDFSIRLKNKSSKRRDSQGKLEKIETPKREHPETSIPIEDQDVHANHVEAFNSSLRRYLSAFTRRSNTYAKSQESLQRVLDIFWLVHNFVRPHFTTREVPAVAMGIIKRGLKIEELLQLPIGANSLRVRLE